MGDGEIGRLPWIAMLLLVLVLTRFCALLASWISVWKAKERSLDQGTGAIEGLAGLHPVTDGEEYLETTVPAWAWDRIKSGQTSAGLFERLGLRARVWRFIAEGRIRGWYESAPLVCARVGVYEARSSP